MTVTYGFYDSVSGDRVYNALQLSSIFDGIITDGIYDNIGDAFVVRANNAMNVLVSPGRAWFQHTWTYNDADFLVTVPTAEVVLDRIDTVIIEVNRADQNRENRIRLISGTPSSTPIPPVLIQSGTLFQYPLADIYVDNGVTVITADKITNRVGTVDCPFVTGVLESLSVDALYANWQAEMDALQLSEQTQFETWFNNLVDQLTTEQVTNLQNQIDTILYHDHGWIPISSTLAANTTQYYNYTAIITSSTNLTNILKKGMRLKYVQAQPLTVAWNFDVDSQSQIITITRTDTSMTYTAGKFSNAATFNGTTSKINMATNVTSLKPITGWTIGGYIKISGGAGTVRTIFYSGSRNTNWAGISIEIDANAHLSVSVAYNTGTGAGTAYDVITGKTALSSSTWYHFTVTFRNDLVRIYLNGSIDAEDYASVPVYDTTTYHLFGAKTLAGSSYIEFFNGQIDDIFIINNYALDEETIYTRSKATSAPGNSNISIEKKGIINYCTWNGFTCGIYLFGGTEYDVSINISITSPAFSSMYAPNGFNPSRDKWQVLYKDATVRTLGTPTANTWYPQGNFQLTVPYGAWDISYNVNCGASDTVNCNIASTLSKVNNAEDDIDFTAYSLFSVSVSGGTYNAAFQHYRSKILEFGLNTIFYLLFKTTVAATNIKMNQGGSPVIIKAVSAYI